MFVSKRLNTLVDLIKYETIADIACDHGFISILACSNKEIVKSIACDLNEEPLSKCIQNAKEYGFEKKIEARLFDGLKGLKEHEAETIIIAGLGGILMEKILSECEYIVGGTKQFLLQPQSDEKLVRKYLVGHYFDVSEKYVKDKGKFYVIFDCVKGDKPLEYSDIELVLGKNVLKDEDFFEYVNHKMNRSVQIQSNIQKDSEKYLELEEYKKMLQEVLNV